MTPDEAPQPRRVILVTGLSGAGKASILKVLEDLGYETVDNPPLGLLPALVHEGRLPLAVGVDVRSRGYDALRALEILTGLRAAPGLDLSLVFATAEAAVLLRRYTETRRRHPMAPGGPLGTRVQDGIAREAAELAPLREAADLVVDTSTLPLPALRRMIEARFAVAGMPGMNVLVQSFAFPRGLPSEADLVFDLRFLRNPHYDPALRPLTGRDAAVAGHIQADPGFAPFWASLTGMLDPLLPRFLAEGKKYLTIALGCTGGRHRSVMTAELLAAHLAAQGWPVHLAHRELGGDHAKSLMVDAPDAPPSPGPQHEARRPEPMTVQSPMAASTTARR